MIGIFTCIVGLITCFLTGVNIYLQNYHNGKNRKQAVLKKEMEELKELSIDMGELCSVLISISSLVNSDDFESRRFTQEVKWELKELERDLNKYFTIVSLKVNEQYKEGCELNRKIEELIESYNKYFRILTYRKFENFKKMNEEFDALKNLFFAYKKVTMEYIHREI